MPFGSLWIPVLVSAVAVFVGSSILHMVVKYHNADYRQLPGEDAVRDALGRAAPSPGFYVTPYCPDMKAMREPATREKYEKGPVAFVTVFPNGAPSMGKPLGLWFLFCILVSFFASYVARHTLHPGTDGMTVMRITSTVAFAGYGLSQVSNSIWMGQPWGNTFRGLFDALVYSLLTGAAFRMLWPA